MNFLEAHFGSTVGKWTVVIPKTRDRNLELRLFRRERPGQYYFDGVETHENKNMEVVGFQFQEMPEGDYAPDGPALSSGSGVGPTFDDNEVIQFLQAMVNEAAKMGIYATGTKDTTREIKTLRDHLEDMRRLLFKLSEVEHKELQR